MRTVHVKKGKEQIFARNLLKKYIRSHIARYGIDGYIIQIDIHQYYQSMRHDILKASSEVYWMTIKRTTKYVKF